MIARRLVFDCSLCYSGELLIRVNWIRPILIYSETTSPFQHWMIVGWNEDGGSRQCSALLCDRGDQRVLHNPHSPLCHALSWKWLYQSSRLSILLHKCICKSARYTTFCNSVDDESDHEDNCCRLPSGLQPTNQWLSSPSWRSLFIFSSTSLCWFAGATSDLTCFSFKLYVCHRRSGPGKQHWCRSQPNLWDRLPQVRAFHPRTSQKKILVRDPKRFKGMAFTLEERQTLGIHGLLPARIKTLDEQVQLYL